jgi:hypothetical protein
VSVSCIRLNVIAIRCRVNKRMKKRCDALCSLGPPWLAHGAKLLHHAQQVGDTPRLGDLSSLYAIYRDAPKVHPIAGRRDAHVLPLVGCLGPPVGYHLVPLGYEVLYGAF